MKMMLRILAIAILTIACVTSVTAASKKQPPQDRAASAPEDPVFTRKMFFPSQGDLQNGEALALDSCESCHSEEAAELDPSLPNLDGQHTVYLFSKLKEYKQSGYGDPGMVKEIRFLSDDALRMVAAYYNSLPAPRVDSEEILKLAPDPSLHDPVLLGQAATKRCSMCHGKTGNATRAGMPNLTGQSPEVFIAAMNDYRDGHRPKSVMTKFAEAADAEAIKNMALFYALQAPEATTNAGTGDVDAGARLARDCAGCHGANGNTTSPTMPSLAGQDSKYLVSAMKEYAEGKRAHDQMTAAVADLGETDLNNLASFYAQQRPLPRKVFRPSTLQEWIARCDRCHGLNGNSQNPRTPILAGQRVDYILKAIEAYSRDERHHSIMTAMTKPMRADQRKGIAVHYAAQQPKSIMYVELPSSVTTKQ